MKSTQAHMEFRAPAYTSVSSTETITTRLTAEVPAAIATLAIRGPKAVEIVSNHVRLSEPLLEVGRVRYGQWRFSAAELQATAPHSVGPQENACAEQVVIVRTDDETIEVHCHGGAAVCQAMLSDLSKAGCAIINQSAWPSKRTCPLARAAEEDLLLATTDRAAAILLDQMQGALRKAIDEVVDELRRSEPLWAARRLDELLRWADLGVHLAHPWKLVLAGPPNVGKSSLLNALVGTQQAIVHHEPGTTRDWLESLGAIHGWPVLLTDTAGVRESDEPIEQAGVERSKALLQVCDLMLLVVDAQHGWTATHEQLLQLAPPKTLVVVNKIDLVQQESLANASDFPSLAKLQAPIVYSCALDSSSTSNVLDAIAVCLFPQIPPAGSPVPFRWDQIERLKECAHMVQHGQLTPAIQYLTDWLNTTKERATPE